MAAITNEKVDLEMLEKIDASNSIDLEIAFASHIIEEIEQIQAKDNFNRTFNISLNNQITISLNFPLKEHAFVCEADFGFSRVFQAFAYEEFAFMYFSLMFEKSIVLISESSLFVSSVISTLVVALKPLAFAFPVIYSLHEDYIELLNTSMPFLIGVNMQPYEFIQKFTQLQNGYANKQNPNLIFIFLDYNLFYFNQELISSIELPIFDGILSRIEGEYKNNFNQQSSNQFELIKTTIDNQINIKFKAKSINKQYEYIERIAMKDIQRMKQHRIVEKFKLGIVNTKYESYQIFKTIQQFMQRQIIEKMPCEKRLGKPWRENKITLIDVTQFSQNKEDIKFLESLFKTKSFANFVELEFDNYVRKKHLFEKQLL